MSIKGKLINVVKYNKTVYWFYSFLGNFGLSLLKLCIRQDPKLILITSFGGRKYDDSPKAIYEAMLKDNRFNEYKIVWAFREPANYRVVRGDKVKIDSFQFYKYMYKARVWLSNSGMERGLFFNAKNVLNVNTWHGSPIKKLGIDSKGEAFGGKTATPTNIWLAQSSYDVKVFSQAFSIPENVLHITGLPRNDELALFSKDRPSEIKRKLGLPLDKKIILYAPTYREYTRDANNNCIQTTPINLEHWREKLSDEYFLLFRAHYEVSKSLNIKDDAFCKDVSSYPDLNELMIASDLLLSDYSSIYFDYSIMDKPMLVYAYDYDEYTQKRGVYFDIREELSDYASTEEEVINNLLSIDLPFRVGVTKRFRDKYVTEFGNASNKTLDLILEGLRK